MNIARHFDRIGVEQSIFWPGFRPFFGHIVLGFPRATEFEDAHEPGRRLCFDAEKLRCHLLLAALVATSFRKKIWRLIFAPAAQIASRASRKFLSACFILSGPMAKARRASR